MAEPSYEELKARVVELEKQASRGRMNGNDRASWLYDLARAQTEHDEGISTELSTRGGLLSALAAVAVVGMTEFWHFHGRSNWLLVSCALLAVGLVFIAIASMGLNYGRPESAREWARWAKTEEENGAAVTIVDSNLVQSIYEDYATCAAMGMNANDAKAPLLNWATLCIFGSIFCLLGALVWPSI